MNEKSRTYSSPLRDQQAQRTRDQILDALTALLGELPSDEITTREIAARAGVSQPTVYRHFPDRNALLEGLGARMAAAIESSGGESWPTTLDDLAKLAVRGFTVPEANVAAATAEAVLNSDPRRLSTSSRVRTAQLRQLVADSLPEYDERDHLRITALLRNLYSVQTWLRMREEFGIRGEEAAPVVAWAVTTLVNEICAGNFPRGEDETGPDS